MEVVPAGRVLADPRGRREKGFLCSGPRTDGEGRLLQARVSARLRKGYAGAGGGPAAGAGFTASLEAGEAYRVEGRLEGERPQLSCGYGLDQRFPFFPGKNQTWWSFWSSRKEVSNIRI